MLELRQYQKECSDIGYNYLVSKEKKPGVIVVPCAGGKSLIAADIARRLDAGCLVMQPSKELLRQNMDKFTGFGGQATIYSASFNEKVISETTFATIQSIKDIGHLFKEFGIKYVIADECHLLPPDPDSMFSKFIEDFGCTNVLGLTATPFRLKPYQTPLKESYSQLNMLPRERPNYFKNILHAVQIQELIEQGYWSPLKYEIHRYDRSTLVLNSTGADFLEESIKRTSEKIGLWAENEEFLETAKRRENIGINNNIYFRTLGLLRKKERNAILVFMDSVENAQTMIKALNIQMGYECAACVHGKMKDKERDRIVDEFKAGNIKVVVNFSALGVGFDNPEIDCVIFGRPTNSLAVYYQALGRGVRIPVLRMKENCLIIDACDNYSVFGRIEDLVIENVEGYGWGVFSGNRILTGVPMGQTVTIEEKLNNTSKYHQHSIKAKTEYDDGVIWFGSHAGKTFDKAPKNWVEFIYKTFNWAELTEERWIKLKKFCEEVLKQ